MADDNHIGKIPDDFNPNDFVRENNNHDSNADFYQPDDFGMRELYADIDDNFFKNLPSTKNLRRKYPR